MGNESHHHQQFYHQKSTVFLPILCSRPSIKDVTLPKCRINPSSSSSCNDPLSPRIGCMGQVKRNNKISGFPIPSSQYNKLITFSNKNTPTISSSPVVKYSKLKSLFSSSRNLTITTPSTATNISSSCTSRTKQRVTRSNKRGVNSNSKSNRSVENVVAINIEAMDPPLPVVKRVPKLEEGDSLWKRRAGGPTIKSLQLQQIQAPKICPQPTTV